MAGHEDPMSFPAGRLPGKEEKRMLHAKAAIKTEFGLYNFLNPGIVAVRISPQTIKFSLSFSSIGGNVSRVRPVWQLMTKGVRGGGSVG